MLLTILIILIYGATLLFLIPNTSAGISLCVALFLLGIILALCKTRSNHSTHYGLLCDIISCLITAAVTVCLAQYTIGKEALTMGVFKFLIGVLIVTVVILFFYCLSKRCIPSILIGAGIFLLISTINVYVYSFRERLFDPADIFSASTAMNVAGNYSLFPIPSEVLTAWAIFILTIIGIHFLRPKNKTGISIKPRIVILAFCIMSSIALSFYVADLKTYHWQREGAHFNGYILDFISKFKEISVSEPKHYSTALIDELASKYSSDSSENESHQTKPPHIIVIMDEAFSDLHVIGDFTVNKEITPFISSLKENTISGYALSSVYGGNTANSEYEFLTGNSMAWLSPNVVPYQQYIHSSTYSMVSYLKNSFAYKAIAMHPFQSGSWNRPVAYEHFGFDECYFIEDFPRKDYVRELISDREMFEYLIETYEAQKDHPLFIFGITMQNHGGYTYSGENFTKHITLNDCSEAFPDVEQYLSLIHETDLAVEHLITYFQNADEPVVILFFGDHLPKINEAFYEMIGNSAAVTLDEQQKRYMVPFFIWSNYDIDEEYVSCTSLSYLSSYVYDAANIPLSPYNRFLQEMEMNIPAINANGYYSHAEGRYLQFEEANEAERSWLDLYEALQYNSIFDKSHRNENLFPVLK